MGRHPSDNDERVSSTVRLADKRELRFTHMTAYDEMRGQLLKLQP